MLFCWGNRRIQGSASNSPPFRTWRKWIEVQTSFQCGARHCFCVKLSYNSSRTSATSFLWIPTSRWRRYDSDFSRKSSGFRFVVLRLSCARFSAAVVWSALYSSAQLFGSTKPATSFKKQFPNILHSFITAEKFGLRVPSRRQFHQNTLETGKRED